MKNGSLYYLLIFSLTFIGFYSVLLVSVYAGLQGITEKISMPLRFLIILLCILLFFKEIRKSKMVPEIIIYLFFFSIYFLRILYDYSLSRPLYIDYQKLILYFISFSAIPFLVITSVNISRARINAVFKGFLYSTVVFSFLATLLYGKYIGAVSRLASAYVEDDVLSPLILSYCSALGIGVLIMFLIYNKVTKGQRILICLAILLNLVPFYLGASRGSILSLFVPFLFLVLSRISIKIIFKSIIVLFISIIVLYYIDVSTGSGLFARFLSIGADVESQSSSASRLGLWKHALNQFMDYPIFGDKLQTNNINIYPHNIILEILQSIGIIGFIPFAILLFKAFKVCKQIFRNYVEFAWIPTIFIQAFVQNMFSGAIYTASWFWVSMALLFSFNYFIKYEER